MITMEMVSKINELARKQREGKLTETEREEQAILRRAYIDNIKNQIKTVFDAAKNDAHTQNCNCGCHHKH
ncbi:MAG: hypothetical protein H6Q73_1932 [Firmicutes bacterium]|nr:hypothetical protein [Bacillota bacterium]